MKVCGRNMQQYAALAIDPSQQSGKLTSQNTLGSLGQQHEKNIVFRKNVSNVIYFSRPEVMNIKISIIALYSL